MFHAAAMPVETFHPNPPVVTMGERHHACEEQADASHTLPCQLNGHLCCLGITGTSCAQVSAIFYGAELFNPVLQILVLQDYPSKQFKPPKFFLTN